MADVRKKRVEQPKSLFSGENIAWFLALLITLPYTLPYMLGTAVLCLVCVAGFKIYDFFNGPPDIKDPKLLHEQAMAAARAKAHAEGKIFLDELPLQEIPPDPPEEEYQLIGSEALISKFRLKAKGGASDDAGSTASDQSKQVVGLERTAAATASEADSSETTPLLMGIRDSADQAVGKPEGKPRTVRFSDADNLGSSQTAPGASADQPAGANGQGKPRTVRFSDEDGLGFLDALSGAEMAGSKAQEPAAASATVDPFLPMSNLVEPVIGSAVVAPVVESIATAPVVEHTAAAPVVEHTAAAPVVDSIATVPVVESITTAPVAESIITAPVVDSNAPAPVVNSIATAPVADSNATVPVVEGNATAPVLGGNTTATAPAVDSNAALPVVASTATAPPPEQPVDNYQLTGSAALLAKFRAQRGAPLKPPVSKEAEPTAAPVAAPAAADVDRKVTILYASQTGTATEIARNIDAECTAKGIPSQLLSFNEVGFAGLSAAKTPVVVFVSSSTGDGDPPDNAAQFWVAIKRRHTDLPLSGVQFASLGLGDSNYTRFMNVPRTLVSRFEELGAQRFYRCVEADEVDGIETTVDPWVDGLWQPIKDALANAGKVTPPAVPATSTPLFVPALSQVVSAAAAAPEPSPVAVAEQVAASLAAAAPPPPPAAPALDLVAQAPAVATAGIAAVSSVPEAVAAAEQLPTALPALATLQAQDVPAVVPTSQLQDLKPDPRTGLVNGLAPAGVDLLGVPALAACRVRLVWEEDAEREQAVRDVEDSAPSASQLAYRDAEGRYSAEHPFWATVSSARVMTAEWSDRRVLHVELDVAGSGMMYEPGDSLGVLPSNSEQLVDRLLARLGVDGQRVLSVAAADGTAKEGLLSHLRWPCTLRTALLRGVDLTSPARKSLLRLLAEACGDEAERRTLLYLASRAGRDAYAVEIMEKQPSVVDLLERFRSCEPQLDALLDGLQPLAPRMYSLASSRLECPEHAHIALSVVRVDTGSGVREGVASTWLDRVCQGFVEGGPPVRVPVYLRSGGDFHPPRSLASPIIMIGPGTGVAPFRGFLQQRRQQIKEGGTAGTAWLFFGCRQQSEDFLYQEELQAFAADGTLQHLHVAQSRAQEHKVYVQDLIRQNAEAIAAAIASGGAYVYVCGDGAKMFKDVHACLVEVLQQNAGLEEAGAYLQQLAKDGRYVRDIWSA